jgi:hypothetical protein
VFLFINVIGYEHRIDFKNKNVVMILYAVLTYLIRLPYIADTAHLRLYATAQGFSKEKHHNHDTSYSTMVIVKLTPRLFYFKHFPISGVITQQTRERKHYFLNTRNKKVIMYGGFISRVVNFRVLDADTIVNS